MFSVGACSSGDSVPDDRMRKPNSPGLAADQIRSPTPDPAQAGVPGTQPSSSRGGILRIAVSGEPASLDVQVRNDHSAWPLVLPMMSWLVLYDQRSGDVEPDLAQSWEMSGAGLNYSFRLNPDATWHDGTPVRATDVVFSIRRIIETPGAPYRSFVASLDRVEAENGGTVSVGLSRPDPRFLAGLGALGNVMVPAHHPPDRVPRFDIVGAGPFRLGNRVPGVRISLERNTRYYRRGLAGESLPYLDGLDVVFAPDPQTGYVLLRLGKVDLTSPANVDGWGTSRRQIEGDSNFRVQTFPSAQHSLLMPNKGRWQNPQLRRLVRDSFDNQRYFDGAHSAYGDPYAFVFPGASRWGLPRGVVAKWAGFDAPVTKSEEAVRSLSEMPGVPKLVSLWVAEEYSALASVALQQIRDLFGETTVLVVDSRSEVLAAKIALDFDLVFEAHPLSLDDPSVILSRRFQSHGSENFGRWSGPKVDSLLEELASSLDAASRRVTTHEVLQRLRSLAWFIDLGTDTVVRAHTNDLKGLAMPLHRADGPQYRLEGAWLDR